MTFFSDENENYVRMAEICICLLYYWQDCRLTAMMVQGPDTSPELEIVLDTSETAPAISPPCDCVTISLKPSIPPNEQHPLQLSINVV